MHTSRNLGKQIVLIETMIVELKVGNSVAIVGTVNPEDLQAKLKAVGVDAEYKAMEATQPLKSVYYQGELVDIMSVPKKHTGYIFTLKQPT